MFFRALRTGAIEKYLVYDAVRRGRPLTAPQPAVEVSRKALAGTNNAIATPPSSAGGNLC